MNRIFMSEFFYPGLMAALLWLGLAGSLWVVVRRKFGKGVSLLRLFPATLGAVLVADIAIFGCMMPPWLIVLVAVGAAVFSAAALCLFGCL